MERDFTKRKKDKLFLKKPPAKRVKGAKFSRGGRVLLNTGGEKMQHAHFGGEKKFSRERGGGGWALPTRGPIFERQEKRRGRSAWCESKPKKNFWDTRNTRYTEKMGPGF